MYRRFKVFVVSFLVSVLFCFSAYADFSSTDSQNLQWVRNYTAYLQTYLPTISANTGFLNGIFQQVEDIAQQLNPYFANSFAQQLLTKLDSIIPSSGDGSTLDFNTENAFYCFDSFHYSGTTNSSYPGMIQSPSGANLVVFNNTSSRYINTYLPAGRYLLTVNIANLGSLSGPMGFVFESNGFSSSNSAISIPSSDFQRGGVFGSAKRYVAYFDVPAGGLYFGDCYVVLDHNDGFACAYVYLVQDNSLSSSVNPDQSQIVSDVDNAGQQQQQQEEQLWTNVNDYKSDLTFNIDDWDDAASGLTYVTGVFMIVWNNSPTQIIILSLMLGIAMLAIGRGVMAAVRVQHNSRRNSQDSG